MSPIAIPTEPTRTHLLVHAHERRDDHDDERHARKQDARERRADVSLAERDEIERPHQLDQREGHDGAPVARHSFQHTSPQCEGDE